MVFVLGKVLARRRDSGKQRNKFMILGIRFALLCGIALAGAMAGNGIRDILWLVIGLAGLSFILLTDLLLQINVSAGAKTSLKKNINVNINTRYVWIFASKQIFFRAYVNIFVWSLGFFTVHLSWINRAVEGELLPQIALVILQSLIVGFVAIGWYLLVPLMLGKIHWYTPLVISLSIAFNFIAIEWVRSNYPINGLPWGKIAFFTPGSIWVSWASWLGAVGTGIVVCFFSFLLGSLVFFFAISLVDFFFCREKIWGKQVGLIIGISGFVIVSLIISSYLLLPVWKLAPEKYWNQLYAESTNDGIVKDLNVLAVQGGFISEEVNEQVARLMLERHRDQTFAALEHGVHPDIIIWPESSTDFDPRIDKTAHAVATGVGKRAGVPLLFGTQEYLRGTKDDSSEIVRYNDFLVWMPTSEIFGRYSKQHPVPFGEYVPFRNFIKQFSKVIETVKYDMLPGNKPAFLEVPLLTQSGKVALSSPICFEIADDAVVREGIFMGAGIIVTPTNDVSFEGTQLLDQQFMIARFRAFEHGMDTVQVSTNGITGFIAPYVNVPVKTLAKSHPGFLDAVVHVRSNNLSFATEYGILINGTILAISFVQYLVGITFLFYMKKKVVL